MSNFCLNYVLIDEKRLWARCLTPDLASSQNLQMGEIVTEIGVSHEKQRQ
jgi:hypothetical protein